jgi:hypothetical protein
MDTTSRPWSVRVSGWVIVVTSILLFLSSLISAPWSAAPAWAIFIVVAGLIFGGARLFLGLVILRGLNWGRVAFLIFELIVVNVYLLAPSNRGFESHPPWLDQVHWLPIFLYLVVLIFLTRKPALKYFGTSMQARTRGRYVVLMIILICIALSGVSSLAYRLGATRLPAVSDHINPVNVLRNSLAEISGLNFLETDSDRAVKKIVQTIEQSKSTEELAEIVTSDTYENVKWVNDNAWFVEGVGLLSLIGVILLLRHY